jgi:hypothetical protein
LGVAVLAVAAPLAIVGVGLLLAALFIVLREQLGLAGAAAITGLVMLLLVGGLVWLFKMLIR